MANETTVQTSCIQESQEDDECRENIPPGVTAAAGKSKFKVQEGDVGFSFTQPSGENEPLSDSCTFSTPAPTSSIGQGKVKSRLSGLQSALTPILKYLNIGNKCPSPEPLKHGNNPHLRSQHPGSDLSTSHTGPSSGDTKAPVCWLNDEYLPEITLLDVTGDSMMQVTKNDSALPDSVPTTPVTAASVKSAFTTPQLSRLKVSTNPNTTAQIPVRQNKTLDLLQSQVSSPKVESGAIDRASSGSKNTSETSPVMNQNSSKTKPPFKQNDTITVTETRSADRFTVDKPSPPEVCNAKEVRLHELSKHNVTTASEDPNDKMSDIPESIDAPLRWLDDRFFPEITLLDVTRDSEFSPGVEISSMNVTQDISPVQNDMPPSELSGQVAAEPGTPEMMQSQDLSSTLEGNVTHTISSFSEQSDKCVGENAQKASLEVTRDISMGSGLEDSEPSLEPSGQNMVKIQTSAENTDTHPANVTHDISSSSDMSVQCAASQLSTSDVERNTTSNVTSELQDEPVVTSNAVEANNEELLSGQDTELSSKVQQPSPKPTESVNTFTVAKQSNMSVSTSVNTTAETPCPQNKTLDLPPSNVNSPNVESDTKDVAISVSKNSSGPSPVVNQNCSPVNASGSCNVQNVTFDRNSLHKSSGNTILGEAVAGTFCLQNTFDTKSPAKQNGTITVSETSSSDSHLNTLDKLCPPKACNVTSSPKDNNSEVRPPEVSKHNEATASTDPDAKTVDTPESTFEANPAVEVAPGADRSGETKDHSQSGLPLKDGLSDSLGHQSMDTEDNKVNTLNLDDTLDLRADALITSTPMTNCKMFNFHTERHEGRIIGAQKKLYGEGPSKPDGGPAPSDVLPNIVCDRKTFLTQPAPKSLLPPLKAASQLLKYKPASLLPGRFDPLTSGLPMTRQRSQAEALRNTAASEAPRMTAGISAPYNLRASTTGSKQPNLGLRKPQLSGIPSGIQRAAPGLKPPSARINTQLSSSTEKLCGPAATNPATKISQAKKHALTRGEALPIAKRKKMDAPLPSGGAAASTSSASSSCDAANKTKNLKPRTTSQKSSKIQRDDTAVPASTAETSTTCNAVSRAKALKQPVTSHRAALPKPQSHGCAKCAVLEQQVKLKSEEIKRLKEELLKYRKPEEEC